MEKLLIRKNNKAIIVYIDGDCFLNPDNFMEGVAKQEESEVLDKAFDFANKRGWKKVVIARLDIVDYPMMALACFNLSEFNNSDYMYNNKRFISWYRVG